MLCYKYKPTVLRGATLGKSTRTTICNCRKILVPDDNSTVLRLGSKTQTWSATNKPDSTFILN